MWGVCWKIWFPGDVRRITRHHRGEGCAISFAGFGKIRRHGDRHRLMLSITFAGLSLGSVFNVHAKCAVWPR
jgi:hypothetical protein